MYRVIYEWPKQDGQRSKKTFDSAIEAVEFMTDGNRDRTDFITSRSTISLYDSKTGDFELISYARLVRDALTEASKGVSQNDDDVFGSLDATGTEGGAQ